MDGWVRIQADFLHEFSPPLICDVGSEVARPISEETIPIFESRFLRSNKFFEFVPAEGIQFEVTPAANCPS